jgi:hypothetical protein
MNIAAVADRQIVLHPSHFDEQTLHASDTAIKVVRGQAVELVQDAGDVNGQGHYQCERRGDFGLSELNTA